MSHPDGDPTGFINPGRHISEATPQFLFIFWLLVSDFSRVFAFSRPLLSFCALLSTFQVLFLVHFILFSLFVTVRILIILGMLLRCIFMISAVLGLSILVDYIVIFFMFVIFWKVHFTVVIMPDFFVN